MRITAQDINRIFLRTSGLAASLIAGALLASASNPVPFSGQPLIPTATEPGGASFILTVVGTGFVSASTVNWNGNSLATTFVSSSELTVTVPSSEISSSSTAAVTASSPAPGGGISNVVYLPVSKVISPVAFSRSDSTVPSFPQAVLTADLNKDGKIDLALADFFSLVVLG